MKHPLSRRQSLKFGLAGLGALGLGTLQRGAWARRIPGLPNNRKALLVFLRGGNDGLNCVVPSLDSSYYSLRPDGPDGIGLSPGVGTLLNGFARLHPSLNALLPIGSAGHLAFLHRVHYPEPSQSHFSSQHYYETAKPGDLELIEGFVPRLLELTSTDAFRGVSLSPKPQRFFSSKNPNRVLAHIQGFETYSLSEGPTPTAQEAKLKAAIAGHYGLPPLPTSDDELARKTGEVMLDSEDQVTPLLPAMDYDPGGLFGYPSGTFGDRLQESIQILRDTTCQIAGVELGGFDNHSDQAADSGMTGTHPNQLAMLAQGLQAIYRDSTSGPSPVSDMLTLVVSEFGRTSAVNTSQGTDHGRASLVIAIGTGVNGGVYNCDATNWLDGDSVEDEGRYPMTKTDFRAVYAEMLDRHFCVSSMTDWEQVIPGYEDAALAYPGLFTHLGFLS